MIDIESSEPQTYLNVPVDPETANEWLTRNVINRTLSAKHVTSLAAMMTDKQWHEVGDPIRFDRTGRLLDGQHRLCAVVESETTQNFTVVVGLPPESQLYMDGGRKRRAGDQLAVALMLPDSNAAAAVVRNYLQFSTGTMISNARTPSTPEIVDWARDHQARLNEAVLAARKVSSAGVPTLISVSGAAYLVACGVAEDDARIFWARLADGVGLEAGNPILHLRNKIIKVGGTGSRNRSHWDRVKEMAYYAHTWNLWRRDAKIARLQAFRDGITLANLVFK